VGSLGAIVVVAASAVIVILIIVLLSKSRSRRVRRTPMEAERHEITSRERRTWLNSQRQQHKPEIAEEHLIPSLDEQLEKLQPGSPDIEAGAISPSTKEKPADFGHSSAVEATAEGDDTEFVEEAAKQEADAGLSAFLIEVSEDDGLSKMAESLEDFDAGNLVEIAKDILSKGVR